MPRYHEKYSVGSRVRIAARAKLEDFHTRWRYHNKLTREQIDFADAVAEVAVVTFYHGGDVLYELKLVCGIWHEECLLDPV